MKFNSQHICCTIYWWLHWFKFTAFVEPNHYLYLMIIKQLSFYQIFWYYFAYFLFVIEYILKLNIEKYQQIHLRTDNSIALSIAILFLTYKTNFSCPIFSISHRFLWTILPKVSVVCKIGTSGVSYRVVESFLTLWRFAWSNILLNAFSSRH